jgi:hypothetical protein
MALRATATIPPMPRHAPRADPFYAIRTRRGPQGIVYRVSFTRHAKNVAKLFRAREASRNDSGAQSSH